MQVIYKIINLMNGKFYVGSTTNQKVRFRQHRKLLRGNRHHCKHLQAAWNKYGEDKFDFARVEIIPDAESLCAAENVWLLAHVGKDYCYNAGRSAEAPMRGRVGALHPSFGVAVPAEQKEAISKTLKAFYATEGTVHPNAGKVFTAEERAKLSAGRKGKGAGPNHYRHGTTLSAEVREKIGAAQRGVKKAPRVLTEAGRAKIKAAAAAGHYANFLGKSHTVESKLKMSRPVVATDEAGNSTRFDSITELREVLGLKATTVNRALKSGKPIAKGPQKGWSFKDAD